MNDLTALRQTIRDKRKQLSPDIVMTATNQVCQSIITLPEYQGSQHIACYVSDENEIDPVNIIEDANKHHKSLYFPVLQGKTLQFCLITQQTQFKKNKFDILEPLCQTSDFIPIQDIDLFLIPLVAFDAQCHRIGRGAGYYDRTLVDRNKNATLIGLAYEFQKVDRIIPEDWDVKMDYIVTEKMVYTR